MNTRNVSSSHLPKFSQFAWLALLLVWLGFSVGTAHAGTLLNWDPSTNNAAADGSGTWDVTGGTTNWYNALTGQDQAWASGSTAIFGNGTSGTYSITLNAATSTAGIDFTTSGYTISGSTLTFTLPITNATGVTSTFSNNVALGGQATALGAGSTLNLAGGFTSSGNPGFHGVGGSTTSVINLTTNGTSSVAGAISIADLTVNQSNGVFTGQGTASAMYVGYQSASPITTATYNLWGGVLTNMGVGISRGNPAVLNVAGGALGVAGVSGFRIAGIDGSDNGTLNMSAGTIVAYNTLSANLPPGSSSANLQPLTLCAAAATYTATAQAIFNFSGGTVGVKGLIFGNPSGHYTANPICQFTMTGGLMYLDYLGIALSNGVSGFTSPVLDISGGTIAATANWTGSMPMTLEPTNGNITFQCSDTNNNGFNITLSGALTGSGGLNKSGSGILTLSGSDNFTGGTIVTNGEFAVDTTASGTGIGPVTMQSGSTITTGVTSSGESWTNAGLTVASGSTVDFNFGNTLLSSSQPVVQVNGNLTWDTSDLVTIEGTSLLQGTYPLIACSGSITLTGGSTLPAIVSLPSGITATLQKSGNTINLVVSGSPNSFIKWGASSSGVWNYTTPNWLFVGSSSPVDYSDGIGVDLNDNGSSVVTINLTTAVTPGAITANNTTNGTASYTITGAGSIGGANGIFLQGSGTLALATPNTYTGGTTVNSGTLAINLGGNATTESPIGTGSLNINGGGLDNTSGSNVVLRYPTQQNWNANFSYVGSQTNLNLGLGQVNLGAKSVQVTVLSNTLECDGVITDNGSQYGLTVQGPGSLSLNGFNNYTGTTVVNSGKLNINNGGDGGSDSAIGGGSLIINGGMIDNTTGTNVILETAIPETWINNFGFGGSGNLDLGSGAITSSALTLTLNGALLQTEGQINASGGGGAATLTLAGNGAFETGGIASYTGSLSITVNSGATVLLDKSVPGSHSALNLTVNAGATARTTGTGGTQVGTATAGLLTLAGGTFDLFGSPTETTYAMTFSSGTLENSSTNPSVFSLVTSMDLTGPDCVFDVVSNSSLTLPNYIYGVGSLVKVDLGTLNLGSTNSYSGSTTVSNGLLTFTTATTGNGDYTVAGGELKAFLDPNGVTFQMGMNSLTFGPGTRVGFDLASGNFGDTTTSLIAGGGLTMNGNVAVDVTNAPSDNNPNILLSYSSRSGVGSFVAGNIPAGAYIYDNTETEQVILTYTQPSALSKPSFARNSLSASVSGGVVYTMSFSGTNGTPGALYEILSTTNLALPYSAWTTVQSGNFDGTGSFNVTVPTDPTASQTFYVLYVP